MLLRQNGAEMFQEQAQQAGAVQPLTPRESEVAALLAEGLGSNEIADRLSLAASSVKWYRRRIFLKLGVHTRDDAAVRLGQLAPSVPSNDETYSGADHPGTAPRPLTSFVGRKREIGELMDWLDAGTARLLTITGAAGCGKSRLALAFAAEAGKAMKHGRYWVNLAATTDSRLVAPAIATALALFIKPGQSAVTAVADRLGSSQALLVLDNCKQIAAECAKVSSELLTSCPGLRIVATSRILFPTIADRKFELGPLSVPASAEMREEEIAGCDSVRLFAERAALVVPGFAVTRQNAVSLSRVCRRLDGLPLAIELAASRVKVLTTSQLDERLEGALALLSGSGAVAARRHATLRAALDWSYGLLSLPERTLLRRLSVFTEGWALEDAESVCAGGVLEATDILTTLSDLVDQSLVVVERPVDGARRFRLLEVIRQYADE